MTVSRLLPLAGSLVLLTGLVAQEAATAPASATPAAAAVPANNDKLQQLVMEAQQLHARQRLGEAMEKINEADALEPDNAMVNNVRGSLYTAMRDFDKAREAFKKSEAKSPGAFEPKFNLTELNYVQGKYADAEAGFAKLLTDYPKIRVEVRHLTQFKMMVCQLKQNKFAEAEAVMKSFTFMDDTPAYYFAQSALFYQKDNKPEAQEWVAKATKIFKSPENVPYLDTMMEAHWIPSMSVPDKE